jgi:DNA/RNA-binding domain of Phe-tRNA-synthetase-like protein
MSAHATLPIERRFGDVRGIGHGVPSAERRWLTAVSATATLFGLYEQVSVWSSISTLPVPAWGTSLGIWLIVRGFNPSPILPKPEKTDTNETVCKEVQPLCEAIGAKPTQHRNAADALLRRLAKPGDIPTINTLVDTGNLVSIRYAMPVAVFDRANIAGPITVRFATGDEPFTDLGSDEIVHPDPGEVVFVDGDDVVSARRWCWRQSATSTTTACALIVIEGHHDTAGQDVESALADLGSLLASHQPQGRTESYVLSPTDPRTGTGEGVENPGR